MQLSFSDMPDIPRLIDSFPSDNLINHQITIKQFRFLDAENSFEREKNVNASDASPEN